PGKDTIVYGGNTTCIEIVLESGKKIIIDAGTGIRALGERFISAGEKVNIHLLVTHIHWDHLIGFPFFSPINDSETKILVDGFHTCMKGLRAVFDNKMGDGFFPITLDDIKADIKYIDKLRYGKLEIDDMVIDPILLHHPQGGYGFRFREKGRTLVFITDNELNGEHWEGRKFEDYVEFCMGADILIHDAQYTPEEMRWRKGWGHSDYESALKLAMSARVRKLILFHHDPSRKDMDVVSFKMDCEYLARDLKADIEIGMAREETELTL
ncbi:MBL fold metallo-hydrolase, partial [Thermodesulfobacteriota bacterium]